MIKKLYKWLIPAVASLATAAALCAPLVAHYEEPDTLFSIMEEQGGTTWGLDRVDGVLDGKYAYNDSAGSGVRVYIVDTGVDATHREFGSRVVDGYDAFGENLDQTDCQGHGTHVAGIAAGSYYGVAKLATIVPVRVLNCSGFGTTTTVIAGLDWILSNHPSEVAGVVNLSLGGTRDSRVNVAVSNLISAGISVVSAAGNFGDDACKYSPASAHGVITVGATDSKDMRPSFSNYGDCVDLFAPGLYILSANSLNHSTSKNMSGTSQASPFVAGALAVLYSSGVANSPREAEAALYEELSGSVENGSSARNQVLKVHYDNLTPPELEPELSVEPSPEPTLEPEPVLPEPEPSKPPVEDDDPIISTPDIGPVSSYLLEVTPTTATIGWGALSGARLYLIRVGKEGYSNYFYEKSSSTLQVELKNLYSNQKYWYTVTPLVRGVEGAASGIKTFETPYGTPSEPRNPQVRRGSLTWDAPTYNGGTNELTYVVQILDGGMWETHATTVGTSILVPTPDSGIIDSYRVVAQSPAGDSGPSKVANIKGTSPAVSEPDLAKETPVSEAGSVSIQQIAAGSLFGVISWEKLATAKQYEIHFQLEGTTGWELYAGTSSNADKRRITGSPNEKYLYRVTAITDTGEVILGIVEYLPTW
jgi:hypothetical protein